SCRRLSARAVRSRNASLKASLRDARSPGGFVSTRAFSFIALPASLALLAACARTARAAPAWPPPAATQGAERALRLHPELQAARLAPEAARAAARRDGAWDPPEVAVDFYNAPLSSFPDPLRRQEEIDWSVSQTLPFPGKRRR